MENIFNNIPLDDLSQEEKDAVLYILQQYASNGQSTAYEDLILQDYKEKPVDIMTFIKDE